MSALAIACLQSLAAQQDAARTYRPTDTVVGLDLATRCGWAVLRRGARVDSGFWDFGLRQGEGLGVRYQRARIAFRELLLEHRPYVVGYELVRSHESRPKPTPQQATPPRTFNVQAAHVYGGLVAVLLCTCEEVGVLYEQVEVAAVKQLATGKGNAKKDLVVRAARERFDAAITDDNEADALWIAGVVTHRHEIPF